MLTRLVTPAPLRLLNTFSKHQQPVLKPPQLSRKMSTFTLPKSVFNPSLYHRARDIWFKDQPLSKRSVDISVLKRWFLLAGDDRDAFDSVCARNFSEALDAISPERFPNPSAEPFLREIEDILEGRNADERVAARGKDEAAWTALSLVILLDQMSRNLFRTSEGLRKVYAHYDVISKGFVDALMAPKSPLGRIDEYPLWKDSIGYRHWFYMPWMHSEDPEAHERLETILGKLSEEEKEEEVRAFIASEVDAARKHKDIIDRFGRYPHRNGALGRESTEEEKQFLRSGGDTFGVKQDHEDKAT
ncbi:DUF924-domain-containing protein [Westerdykella ornata]|uniref:DUF924-domain-containing protein n=1 Tax=Westerdykella ornata TaxID=318751 RepID=A0A6A6JMK3_WESOR|nr:DUF924-domain-containing protein [Westerdykella ornata]KAF2277464.1 DUF924-domain-containing protein [Westerdykella ornata]